MTAAPVLLVQMPYGGLSSPSPALGLLKAILERDGISTRVLHANLEFADELGAGNYERIARESTRLIGEWTFAGAAFPGFQPDQAKYLDRVGRIYAPDDPEALARAADELWTIRKKAGSFVERLADRIVQMRPRIVGCTSTFQQHCASLALLRTLRAVEPSIVTMLGGANCEGVMGWTTLREFPWVDVVVSGEADGLIVDLCRRLLSRGAVALSDRFPDGVFTRRAMPASRRKAPGGLLPVMSESGGCSETESGSSARAVFADLDANPIPDYDEYFEALAQRQVAGAITPGLPIETSRGCWWGAVQHCTFCGLNGGSMTFRSKSPERAVSEFTQLAGRYGIRRFGVVDNILDMSYFREVLPRLAALGERMSFFYEVKANLSKEQIAQLADAGGTWLQPGLESLHDEALRAIKKGTTAINNIQLLKWTREMGIFVLWSILHGIPGEKPEWYDAMCAMVPKITHLQPPLQVSPILYQRFSPYHTRAHEYGLKLEPSWPHFWVYPVNESSMRDLAYSFDDVAGTGLKAGEFAEGDLLGTMPEAVPEIRALRNECAKWRKHFYSALPPILSMTDMGSVLRIVDTRQCAAARVIDLRELERRVYLTCERAVSVSGILREWRAQAEDPGDEAAIHMALASLCERNLMIESGGRYLALATGGDIPSLKRGPAYPAGYVDRTFVPSPVSGTAKETSLVAETA